MFFEGHVQTTEKFFFFLWIWIFCKKFGNVGWNIHNFNEEKRNNLCFFQPCLPCHPWILMVRNVICRLSFSLVLVPWVLSGFIRILWFSSPSHVQNQSFQISTQLGTMENKEPLCGCTTVTATYCYHFNPYLAKRRSINYC